MPSPFPGMNPYLEQEGVWHGFHEWFISHVANLLVPQVRPRYIVTIDETAYLHELPGQERQLLGRPDVGVTRAAVGPAPGVAVATAAGIQAPAYGEVPVPVDVERLSFVQIRDRISREVVTAIELLSPANKYAGPEREQYLAKRRRLLRSSANLIEIDLLRGGPRLPVVGLPPCDYCVLLSRREERPRVALWPIGLRDALPPVPIPLRGDEPTARLELQAALHHVYDAGGFEDYVYSQGDPRPQLDPSDAAWADALVPRRD